MISATFNAISPNLVAFLPRHGYRRHLDAQLRNVLHLVARDAKFFRFNALTREASNSVEQLCFGFAHFLFRHHGLIAHGTFIELSMSTTAFSIYQ